VPDGQDMRLTHVRRGAAALLAAAVLSSGCASPRWQPIGVETTVDLARLVDSDRARALLADLLAREPGATRLAARVATVVRDDLPGERAEPAPLPRQEWLRELAQAVSMDFAALVFARAVEADAWSREVQSAFARFMEEGPARCEEVLRRPGAFPYTVLLAPSWLHRSHPENGADFARQRRLLDRLGIANRLIETAESGSVEDNASIIAAAVREAPGEPGSLILVSASKSGAEVAYALTHLLTSRESARVAGWLNVAGALHGTPLADAALRPPASWIARLVFSIAGWNWAGLASMATAPSRSRIEGASIPKSLAVLNLVAIPVSGSVGSRVFLGYEILRRHGPNDGVVLLADTVWPGGANIVALGADHLFNAQQQDAHGMAMLRAMDFVVKRQRGSPD